VTRAERILLVFLCSMAAFAPIFLGGVGRFEREDVSGPPGLLDRFLWAHGPYAILTFLGVATASVAVVVAADRRDAGEPPLWRLHGGLVLPLAALSLLGLLQLVPIPRGLLALLSPQADRQLAALLPGDGAWRPLSVSPGGTWAFLGGLGIGGAALLGALLVARTRAAAFFLLGTLVATYAAVALYGMWEVYAGGNTILGYPRAEGAGVSATFVNRSHMAAAAGICLPIALALGFWGTRTALRGRWGAGPGSVLALAAAGVLAIVVPLTRSRMGLASAAAGVVVFGLLAARATRWPLWGRGLLALAVLAVVAGGLKEAWDRMPELRERVRLGRTEKGFFDIRFPAWTSTLELAARYPALGTGLGSYETAIHETQTPANPDEIVHAHSEPLEMLSDGGLLGLAIAAVLAFAAARGCHRLAGEEDPGLRAIGCGCGGALAALLVGCLTEFHLRIPALGIAAAVIVAIPAALGAGEPRATAAPTLGRRRAIVAWAAILLGVAAAVGQSRAAAAEGAAVRAEKAGDGVAWIVEAREAVGRSGSAFSHRSLSGALLAGEWIEPGIRRSAEESLAHAERAVDLEPFNAFAHWSRVRPLLALRRFPDAVDEIRRTRTRAGGIGHLLCAGGIVLLEISRSSPELQEEALLMLREAGNCYPQFYSRACEAVDRMKIDRDLKMEIAPERWIPLGRLLEEARRRGDALSEKRLLRRLLEIEPGNASNRERLRALESEGPHKVGK
jgi:hypothetical protein